MKRYALKKLDNPDWAGLPSSEIWAAIQVLNDFTYPWRADEAPGTTFQAFYTEAQLYFRFTAQDRLIREKIASRSDRPVVESDRVEIFFRADAQMHPYYCLEIDARAGVLDYIAHYHRQFDYDWQWPEGQLMIDAIFTPDGYEVTGAVSMASLKELGVWKANQLEVGLYRAEYVFDAAGQQKEVKWISWCKTDSPHPDFHIPSSFGTLIF